MQVALKEGSSFDVAVITAVPAVTPVTSPLASTVATAGLDELQVTSWLAFEGVMVAFSCTVFFTDMVRVSPPWIEIPSTLAFTVTLTSALRLLGFAELGVIYKVTEPTFTPSIFPSETEMIPGVEVVYLKPEYSVSAGSTVTVSALPISITSPTYISSEEGETETLVTGLTTAIS